MTLPSSSKPVFEIDRNKLLECRRELLKMPSLRNLLFLAALEGMSVGDKLPSGMAIKIADEIVCELKRDQIESIINRGL